MANNLSVTGGGTQAQTSTQDPQSLPSTQSLDTGTPSSGVQPGTAASLLNGQAGVPLHGTALSTVNLAPGATATQTHASTAAAAKPKHHTNPVLFGVAVLLLLVAIVLFWLTSRSVKNTT